jgi:putative redox protein
MTQVVVTGDGGLRQQVWAGKHSLVVDEPAELGGEDSGPNPYELLLAALGACTSITLTMYAQRKGWPLEQVEVRLSHERVHANDCADCEEREGYLDVIEKEIVVGGELSDEQVTRLGEIAEKCPVNRTLHATVHTRQKIRRAGESAGAG